MLNKIYCEVFFKNLSTSGIESVILDFDNTDIELKLSDYLCDNSYCDCIEYIGCNKLSKSDNQRINNILYEIKDLIEYHFDKPFESIYDSEKNDILYRVNNLYHI